MQNEPQLSAEEVIKDVLTGIKALVQKEMEADQIYQMMLKTESVGDAIDLAEHLMMSLALKLTDVLKSKGVKMDNERFRYLLALPYHMSMLEKHIEKTEGMTCCVDKAYSRVVQYINGGKIPMDGSELATALEEQREELFAKFEEDTKELRHFHDTTIGLLATDRSYEDIRMIIYEAIEASFNLSGLGKPTADVSLPVVLSAQEKLKKIMWMIGPIKVATPKKVRE